MSSLRILISRRRGGIGDVICCEVAVRALRQRFGPKVHIIWAMDDPYFVMWYDQVRSNHSSCGPDEVIWPDPWGTVIPVIEKECHAHFQLDGPEMRHQLDTNYSLTESRIENWVKYVDCVPDSMCPKWYPQESEKQRVAAQVSESGVTPFNFILIQWASAEKKKDYPHTVQLIEEFKALGYQVIVTHHGKLPDLGVFAAISWPFRELACLTQIAALAIGPDSFLQHMAAAVDTPSIGLFGPTNPELYLKHYPLSDYFWHRDVKGKSCEATFPCYGLFARNWWCSKNVNHESWCAKQIDPKIVALAAHEKILALKNADFYKRKAEFLTNGSTLFYLPDLRVDLVALHNIQNTTPLMRGFRKSKLILRQPCLTS